MDRRLTAIVGADYVNSAEAVETNHETAICRIGECMRVIWETAETYGAREIGKEDDLIFFGFQSPTEALRSSMAARAKLAKAGWQSNIRFGMHLAELAFNEGAVLGAGVSIAARILMLAEPGQIEISEDLMVKINQTSAGAFEYQRDVTFKGMSAPIRVFRVTG